MLAVLYSVDKFSNEQQILWITSLKQRSWIRFYFIDTSVEYPDSDSDSENDIFDDTRQNFDDLSDESELNSEEKGRNSEENDDEVILYKYHQIW